MSEISHTIFQIRINWSLESCKRIFLRCHSVHGTRYGTSTMTLYLTIAQVLCQLINHKFIDFLFGSHIPSLFQVILHRLITALSFHLSSTCRSQLDLSSTITARQSPRYWVGHILHEPTSHPLLCFYKIGEIPSPGLVGFRWSIFQWRNSWYALRAGL